MQDAESGLPYADSCKTSHLRDVTLWWCYLYLVLKLASKTQGWVGNPCYGNLAEVQYLPTYLGKVGTPK